MSDTVEFPLKAVKAVTFGLGALSIRASVTLLNATNSQQVF